MTGISGVGGKYSLHGLEQDEIMRDEIYPERSERVTREWAEAIMRIKGRRIQASIFRVSFVREK